MNEHTKTNSKPRIRVRQSIAKRNLLRQSETNKKCQPQLSLIFRTKRVLQVTQCVTKDCSIDEMFHCNRAGSTGTDAATFYRLHETTMKEIQIESICFNEEPCQVTRYCVDGETIVKEPEYKISGNMNLFFCFCAEFFLRVKETQIQAQNVDQALRYTPYSALDN